MRSANDAFGKAGFGHRRQPSSAHRQGVAPRKALDGIVCYAAAGAAILFLVAVVLGLVGH
jgi:hypothetical protein